MTASLDHSWTMVLRNAAFRLQLAGTVAALILLAIIIPLLFDYIQHRGGVVLPDPILDMMRPRDVSWITFTLIYASLSFGLLMLWQTPARLVLALQAYCILYLFRIFSLLLVPLDEPPGLIVLRDPFVAVIGYGGDVITKDLFFSGHVSTMTLLVLAMSNKVLKGLFIVVTVAIAFLLLVQHVHYTIDVVVAPVFSLVSFRLAQRLGDKLRSA